MTMRASWGTNAPATQIGASHRLQRNIRTSEGRSGSSGSQATTANPLRGSWIIT